MNAKLTEEEMRRALFGPADSSTSAPLPPRREEAPPVIIQPPAAAKRKVPKSAFTPRLRVTLRVGNVYEGETYPFTYDADTLSKLLAEQEATKAARKKYRYIELVSVEPLS